MKKLLFILACTFATLPFAQAQSGFGIRGGANLSNLSGDLRNESRYENKVGFHAGILYNINLVGDFFSIQPELLYTSKGFKNQDLEIELPTGTFRREGTINYNYLDLPVLARIKAGPLYVEAGPQASYLLGVNNKIKESLDGERISSSTTDRDKEGLTDFELGYAAGVGLAFNNLSVGVRYNGSFTDLVDENPQDYFDGDLVDARHSVFMLTLALKFSSAR